MTEEQALFVKEKLEEIYDELDMQVGAFLFSENENGVIVYGCPACLMNLVKQWVADNPDIKHTPSHGNGVIVN